MGRDRHMREFLGRRQSGLIAIMLAITVRQRWNNDPDVITWRARPPMPILMRLTRYLNKGWLAEKGS